MKNHDVPSELVGLERFERSYDLCERLPRMMATWRRAYPSLDVASEIKKAHTWLLEHPEKKYKKLFRFLGNWMRRASPCKSMLKLPSQEGRGDVI
jgi:hypothetical protein